MQRDHRRRRLWIILVLLLLLSTCSYLEGSLGAMVTQTFRLSDDVRDVLGDAPLAGLAGEPVALPIGAAPRGPIAVATPGGRGAGSPAPAGAALGGEEGEPQGQSQSAAQSAASSAVPPSSSIGSPVSSAASVSVLSSRSSLSSSSFFSSRASLPSGGETPGSEGAIPHGPGGPPSQVVTVQLRSSLGEVIHPRFHFEAGTARLEIDERSFIPGFYTLRVVRTDPLTGQSTAAEQEFAWGVLALNADKDRYLPGQTGALHIGVLDEFGEIVCNADLTLQITAPSGTVSVLTTADGDIAVHDTCGLKQAGLLDPDYSTSFTFGEEGTYTYLLTAVRPESALHAESSIDGSFEVVSAPPFIVTRTAATRLWPFGPSTMTIEVAFLQSFAGTVTDIVPEGFQILSGDPTGIVIEGGSGPDTIIRWNGSWAAGETATFQYVYDAPDISPQFYLVGPLEFAGPGGMQQELRSWQIANDAAVSSNYRIKPDVIASGGGDYARSTSYLLSDTIGEFGIGPSDSPNYQLDAGYRQTLETSISLACDDLVVLGTIVGAGLAEDTITCTVIADGDAGYGLSWIVETGSGGTNTGHLISESENIIAAYTPTVAGTPETWSISASDARWGGRLSSTSTDTDAKWGTDNVSEKWLNVGTGSYTVVERATRTATAGSTQIIEFRSEVGGDNIKPDGTYQTTVTITASGL